MKTSLSALASPSQWTVRTRTTVAATVVVTLCLMLAGGALLVVLFRSLETSAESTADARAAQVVEQLRSEPGADLDRRCWRPTARSAWCRSSIDPATLVASAGGPPAPVASAQTPPGSRYLSDGLRSVRNDFWVTGAVPDTVGSGDGFRRGRSRAGRDVVTTVAVLIAIGGRS